MDPGCAGKLSENQGALLSAWIPGFSVIADLSWGQTDTVVLMVRSQLGRFIVKAAGSRNHHIGREITGHLEAVPALALEGLAPTLRHFDRENNILVTDYLAGQLVLGTPAEMEAETHFQAGVVLKKFHGQSRRLDPGTEARANRRAVAWLDSAHRIETGLEDQLRNLLAQQQPHVIEVVPTHGDWQPRNWLMDAGTVKMIDFGRYDHRPAASDFARLAVQQWKGRPELEAAFLDGYGEDPRTPELWPLFQLREAIGTAAWAFQVGDRDFEQQGLQVIANALELY